MPKCGSHGNRPSPALSSRSRTRLLARGAEAEAAAAGQAAKRQVTQQEKETVKDAAAPRMAHVARSATQAPDAAQIHVSRSGRLRPCQALFSVAMNPDDHTHRWLGRRHAGGQSRGRPGNRRKALGSEWIPPASYPPPEASCPIDSASSLQVLSTQRLPAAPPHPVSKRHANQGVNLLRPAPPRRR